MNRRLLVSTLLLVLAFLVPGVATPGELALQQVTANDASKTGMFVPRPQMIGQQGANEKFKLTDDETNLPEAASALPLLSAIGAGALIGGFLSARRTRK
jgi:hypothetical protein